MRTTEDMDDLLAHLELPYERLGEGMWVLVQESEKLVLCATGELVTFRMKVADLPPNPSLELFRRLLELNASALVHGAFGIEGDALVLVDSLELANLDGNELAAVIAAFELAVAEHRNELALLLQS